MSGTTTVEPRIWIGCLAAYNSGHLHGEWVDAAVDEDEIWEAQKRVLKTSPVPGAEEHFIADYEGFGDYRVGEYDGLATVAKVARLIDEHGEAFGHWLSNGSVDPTDEDEHDLEEGFREAYAGHWQSEREYAENLVDDIGLPGVGFVYKPTGRWSTDYEVCTDDLSSLLDWDAVTRATMEGGWSADASDGGVHVFRDV